ncbi:hypothetical protein EBQ26_10550 [Allofranklinella schreckenbergeri]|uniref:DUF7210 domain-containing protein n=1 Tax=Allofranklinella schreckenbergeri TaxID=1076744 RepID=A0A3M6PYE6_9BURK|nr:hypothetical protein [Allofranklinella schreckenbergeri]RMW96037.1 hypothetical protein EBQ26_10550 [Allofranklinella schreckenbergeri]
MQTTTIHLLRPHRHAGRDYPAGAQLTLPAHKAAWLMGLGVAQNAPAAAPAAAPEGNPTKGKKE